ncbi:MAG TPA: NUDIX domain-containing protein [Steroidobacteraceae bacterium]|nr:NUDIX domain-containing protein [Steroidobacteraceae bacterium]
MPEPVLSAGVVVVRCVDDEWRVLLLRVYNYWDFPKGRVETGETALATAKRETREETTLDDLEFAWGESFMDTAPYGREKKVARFFLARTTTEKISLPVNPELGKPEHHEWRWCDWESAEQLVPERVWPVLRWAQDLLD